MDLNELRKIAEAATQGVWERFDVTDLDTFGVTDLAHVLASELETEDAVQAVATGVTREDAQHIATFDPPTVLRLLDLVESEAEYAELNPKLAAILRGTAKALKGEPEPLISHSWHDLAEVATELITRLEQAEQAVARVREMAEEMGEGKAFGILTRGREDEYPISYFIEMLEEALDGEPNE